jgi:hypothetical protein
MDLNGFDGCECSLSSCNISRSSSINLICAWVQIISKLGACILKGFGLFFIPFKTMKFGQKSICGF